VIEVLCHENETFFTHGRTLRCLQQSHRRARDALDRFPKEAVKKMERRCVTIAPRPQKRALDKMIFFISGSMWIIPTIESTRFANFGTNLRP
jgi:hypothetical protein